MMRFIVIAAERAPTIATMIHKICRHDGQPAAACQPGNAPGIGGWRAASRAPVSANGSAKTECSNLIISRIVRMRLGLTGKPQEFQHKGHREHREKHEKNSSYRSNHRTK